MASDALIASLLLRFGAALASHGSFADLRSTTRTTVVLGLSAFLLARTERHGAPLVSMEEGFGTRTRADTVHPRRDRGDGHQNRGSYSTLVRGGRARTICSRSASFPAGRRKDCQSFHTR